MNKDNRVTPYYENIEFTLSNGASEYNLDTQQSGFLSKFGPTNVVGRFPTSVQIRTNFTISVKLNATTNDAVTITSTDSPYSIEGVEISNMFLSNSSGSDAAVKLFFQDVKY